jgi:hypothetical protein
MPPPKGEIGKSQSPAEITQFGNQEGSNFFLSLPFYPEFIR